MATKNLAIVDISCQDRRLRRGSTENIRFPITVY